MAVMARPSGIQQMSARKSLRNEMGAAQTSTRSPLKCSKCSARAGSAAQTFAVHEGAQAAEPSSQSQTFLSSATAKYPEIHFPPGGCSFLQSLHGIMLTGIPLFHSCPGPLGRQTSLRWHLPGL